MMCQGMIFLYSFVKRINEVSSEMCQNIKRNRAGISRELMEDYFNELQSEHDTVHFEKDKTNLCDDPGKKKVITKRDVNAWPGENS